MHPLVRLSIAIFLVALSALVACDAAPVVGPELRVCPMFDAAPGNQDSVQIAAGTDGYLAVWRDTRGGVSDIFACRLDSSGAVIDLAAIAVCRYASEQTDPAVAFNGVEYLVVWSDRRLGPQHIYGARVRLDGTVIDPEGILLSGTAGFQAFPRVASDGRGWQVVWQDSRGGSQDIYGVKMNGTGVLERVTGIVTLSNNNEETPDVAYNGSTYFVVWRDYRNIAATDADIYGCRVAVNGIRMAGDLLVSCDSTGVNGAPGLQSAPRICSLGSNSMVVWEDYRGGDGTTCDVRGTRVTPNPVVLDRNGIVIASGTGNQELPSVGYDGSKVLVTWRERSNRNVRGARMSASGSLLDPSGFTIYNGSAGSEGIGVCNALSGGFWVAWNNLSIAGDHVFANWVPATGSVGASAGNIISLAQKNQSDYSVADNGSEYAVVWSQNVGGKECILGARISYAGELLTPNPINITGSVYGQQGQPSISWNGSQYLLVWCGNESYLDTNLDIRGLRLNSDLSPKDGTPILVCTALEIQRLPYVCSNGSSFLVVWEDSRNALSPNYFTDVFGALVTANGEVTALKGALNMYIGNQTRPRATSDGSNYFAVWEDYRYGYCLVYGARVTSSGTVSPSAGTPMPATSSNQTTPYVQYGGGNYLVTWSDGYRIAGCRVNTSGVVVDTSGISIESAATAKGRPSLCWDGVGFQAVWEDYRSQMMGNSDVYYNTLSSAGVVDPAPSTGLVSDLTPQTAPRIFGNVGSGVLFYNRVENYVNSLCLVSLSQQLVPVDVALISTAKTMAAGTTVCLRGKVVTAVFSGGFYAEEVDRSSSVRVLSDFAVQVGDVVDITGVVGTSDGERQITTGTVAAMGIAAEPVKPFALRGDMLGGAASGAVPGITGGTGANNLGMLVKTWGTVTELASGYFTIECIIGTSVRVKSGNLIQPRVGDKITVVGISTCHISGGAVCRAILPRTQADIVIVKPAP